jgi:hypothetical protein
MSQCADEPMSQFENELLFTFATTPFKLFHPQSHIRPYSKTTLNFKPETKKFVISQPDAYHP